MPNLNLAPEHMENIRGVVKGDLNEKVLEGVSPLANLLRNNPSDNPMEEKLLEAANNFQDSYNSFTENLDKIAAELNKFDDMREYLSKKDNGSVNRVQAELEEKGVNRDVLI